MSGSRTKELQRLREEQPSRAGFLGQETKPGEAPATCSDCIRKFTDTETKAPEARDIMQMQEETYTTLGVGRMGIKAMEQAIAKTGAIIFIRPRKHMARLLGVNEFSDINYSPKPMNVKAKSIESGAKAGLVEATDLPAGIESTHVKSSLLHLMCLERKGEVTDVKYYENNETNTYGYTGKNVKDGKQFFWKLNTKPESQHRSATQASFEQKPEQPIPVPEWFIDDIPADIDTPYTDRKEKAQTEWNAFINDRPEWHQGQFAKYQSLSLYSFEGFDADGNPDALTEEHAAAEIKNGKPHYLKSDTDLGAIIPQRRDADKNKKIKNITEVSNNLKEVKDLIDTSLYTKLQNMTWDEFCKTPLNTSKLTKHDQITGFNTGHDLLFQLLVNKAYRELKRVEKRNMLLEAQRAARAFRRYSATADLTGVTTAAIRAMQTTVSSDAGEDLEELFHFLRHGADVWNPAGISKGDWVVLEITKDESGHITGRDYAVLQDPQENPHLHIEVNKWLIDQGYYAVVPATTEPSVFEKFKNNVHAIITDGAAFMAKIKATAKSWYSNCCAFLTSCCSLGKTTKAKASSGKPEPHAKTRLSQVVPDGGTGNGLPKGDREEEKPIATRPAWATPEPHSPRENFGPPEEVEELGTPTSH